MQKSIVLRKTEWYNKKKIQGEDLMDKTVKIKVVVQSKKENVPGWPHINFGYEKETEKIMRCVREYNPDILLPLFPSIAVGFGWVLVSFMTSSPFQ